MSDATDGNGKPIDLESAYRSATFGRDCPSIIYTSLGQLRRMYDHWLGDDTMEIRSDVRIFVRLTKDIADDQPIMITRDGIGFCDVEVRRL